MLFRKAARTADPVQTTAIFGVWTCSSLEIQEDSDIKVGVARSLEAVHAPTDAEKGRGPMVPSFFTISSFYVFFNMLSMEGISFAVKAFSVVVFTLPCEPSANANAAWVSSLGHSPIVM
jgi:hypothetical protein